MGIAHEVSTPLGIIAGRAEQILPRVSGDDRSTRGMQAIIEQAERIRRVIRGFLDLARGGAPELRSAPPASVLREAQALVEHRFAKAGVSLSVTAPAGDLPPSLAAGGALRARVQRAGDPDTGSSSAATSCRRWSSSADTGPGPRRSSAWI